MTTNHRKIRTICLLKIQYVDLKRKLTYSVSIVTGTMFQLKFWLVVYMVILNSKSFAQSNETVIPDILLLSEEFFNITRLTCVADTNALHSALVFNTKLNVISESMYVPTNNQYKHIFNCDFANLKKCHSAYNSSSKMIKKSGKHFIAPILDERWEKFPLIYSDRIKIGNNQALSIKMNNKLKLKLVIGSTNIVEQEIDNQITDSVTKWIHFAIKVSQPNKTITIFGNEQKTYRADTDDFTNIFIRTNSRVTWKNHIYNYMTLDGSVGFVQIGPEYEANRTHTLCISMHVAACQRCEFHLQIMNETNHIVSNVVRVQSKVRNSMVHWDTVRLTAPVSTGSNYKLVANNIESYLIVHSGPLFWAIDDIRECNIHEIRISKLYTTEANVSCEALKFPNWNIKQNNRNRTENVFNCTDDRYIGRNCNISCQSVVGSQRCDRNVLCQPARESQDSECRCAGEYFGPNCNEDCKTGHVVYQCKTMYEHVNATLMRLTHTCENQKICSTHSNSTHSSDSKPNYQMYLPLLALLAIPVIAFLLYWFILRKRCDPHYIRVNPRVGSYIEVLNENGTGSISNIPMTAQNNEPSIYGNVKNIAEMLEMKAIYSNIAGESQYANVNSIGAPELPLAENIYVNIGNCRPVIEKHNFEVYIEKALNNQEFEKQYAFISQDEMKPCKYGSLEANIYKHQYKNVLPYDENRVALNIINGDPYSDYINASYIEGCQSKKDYIATQHPKQQTINDFWRMIWQEDVKYIIMLSNSYGNNALIKPNNNGLENYSLSRVDIRKQKSQMNYWPKLHSTEDYGMVKVTHLYTDSYVSYEIRTFEANVGTENKRVTQLAFTSWPDNDIPNHPQYFTEFVRYVSKIPSDNAPIVVHSSAGIGRTGVLILCDICLRMSNKDGYIDVFKYAQKLQKQRFRMINNIVHYKLVYLTLLDCLLSPETEFSTDNDFYDHIRNMLNEKKLQEQLDYLEKITYFENALVKKNKNTYVKNESRNRFPDIVPEYDSIYLTDHEPKNKDAYYINAVPVDGYKKNNQFIVTQYPLPNTLAEFWQMIFKKHVKVIVSLNDIPVNDMTCCEFWPTNNEELQPIQSLCIEHVATEHYEFHSVFTLVFKTLYIANNVEDRTVYVIHLKGWAPNTQTPERVFHLYRILGEVETLWKRKLPVVVTCYNGATACGLFVALTYLLDQMTEENECDVYAAIRVIRKNRRQFISNKEQLEFLYKGVLKNIHVLDKQQIYENIQQVRPNI